MKTIECEVVKKMFLTVGSFIFERKSECDDSNNDDMVINRSSPYIICPLRVIRVGVNDQGWALAFVKGPLR